MELVNEVLHKYCESHSKVFNEDVLLEIDRFTNLNVLMPQMLSGYLQGQYLAMMSKMIQSPVQIQKMKEEVAAKKNQKAKQSMTFPVCAIRTP